PLFRSPPPLRGLCGYSPNADASTIPLLTAAARIAHRCPAAPNLDARASPPGGGDSPHTRFHPAKEIPMSIANEPLVFVIDDDAQSSRAVAELVRTFGHQVQVFQNPREFLDGLDAIDPAQVGCVITDLRMNGVDGLEVLHRLIDRAVAL